MQNLELLEELFDKNIIRMLQLFLSFKEKKFYMREISKETKIPIASTSRILTKLVKLELIELIKINRFKLYQLNDNDDIRFLKRFLKKEIQILDKFVDSIKNFPGIERVILHGEQKQHRADVLLIGEDIDSDKIKETVGALRDTSKFTVSALILTNEQYDQMSEMGMYTGKKRILFERD